jgi:GNAT superfamily N-acetyltransferase
MSARLFTIREVDGADVDAEADLTLLHKATFEGLGIPDLTDGHWWIACENDIPVAFAGVIASTLYPLTGYYKRVGVLPEARGWGLQLRLTRALEARCRRNGWFRVVSDTRDNVPSANNFIQAGYHLFEPATRWAFADSLYWRKML